MFINLPSIGASATDKTIGDFLKSKTLLLLTISLTILCGCNSRSETSSNAAQQNTTNVPNVPNNPFANNAGNQNLTPESSAQQAGPANWGNDRVADAKPQPFKRGKLLAPPEMPKQQQQQQVDPYAAKYDKWRLERAATVRNWASVSMAPHGIDAFLHTVWTQGVMHVRVALLGPGENLRIFCRDHRSLKMTFQDQDGNYMQSVTIPTSMLKEASPGTNGGNPTYFVEGQMEVPLENYERFYQWVFEWDE